MAPLQLEVTAAWVRQIILFVDKCTVEFRIYRRSQFVVRFALAHPKEKSCNAGGELRMDPLLGNAPENRQCLIPKRIRRLVAVDLVQSNDPLEGIPTLAATA